MLSQFGLVPTSAKSVNVGDVFGRLTVEAVGQIEGTYRYYAVCRCSCGSALRRFRMDGLISAAIVGCGCVRQERTVTHGLTRSIHYNRWRNILDRCRNPDSRAYPNYGGRGIRVCEDWVDLATFVNALPSGYFDGAEIDRIDNDGHYEPGNVRWVTRQQNTDNRRSGHKVEWNGKIQSVTAWANDVGISRSALQTRFRDGWSVERALTEKSYDKDERMLAARTARWGSHIKPGKPSPRIPSKHEYQGEMRTIADLSAICGVPIKLLRKRICERGWSVERAATEYTKE